MAGSVNKVIIIGNVGRDPEIRTTQDGTKIAHLSVATTETRKDKNTGERIDKTEWHRVVIFNEHIVDIVEKYVKKGAKLYIEGQLQTRKWTDPQGIDRYITEVVLGRYKGELGLLDNRANPTSSYDNAEITESSEQTSSTASSSFLNDDVPF